METRREVKEAPVNEQSTPHLVSVGPDRIKAFSDGVFAIALTLLILQVKVPSPSQIASEKTCEVSCSNSGLPISATR